MQDFYKDKDLNSYNKVNKKVLKIFEKNIVDPIGTGRALEAHP